MYVVGKGGNCWGAPRKRSIQWREKLDQLFRMHPKTHYSFLNWTLFFIHINDRCKTLEKGAYPWQTLFKRVSRMRNDWRGRWVMSYDPRTNYWAWASHNWPLHNIGPRTSKHLFMNMALIEQIEKYWLARKHKLYQFRWNDRLFLHIVNKSGDPIAFIIDLH